MKRLLILVFFAFVLWPHAGRATTCSVPNTFVNGTTADANQVNSNFSSLVSCGNAIDNTNIGSSGIYASQIKPTTALQATFGGSIGYTFNPNAAAQVPLTILNAASPTADYLDVTNSGATKLAWVDSAGSLNALVVAPSATFSGQNGPVVVAQATAAPTAQPGNISVSGLVRAAPSPGAAINPVAVMQNPITVSQPGGIWGAGNSEIDGTLFGNNGGNKFLVLAGGGGAGGGVAIVKNAGGTIDTFPDAGGIESAPPGVATQTYLPPVYTSAGAAVANTLHGVIGTCVFSSSTTCNVTLSGAAVFASSTSYSCSVSNTGSSVLFVAQSLATTSFQLSTQASTTTTATYACFGT